MRNDADRSLALWPPGELDGPIGWWKAAEYLTALQIYPAGLHRSQPSALGPRQALQLI